ncbi:hypothetical protein ACF0H5_018462 [Mactra antiquata]
MDTYNYLMLVMLWSIIIPYVKGGIMCECTTLDCEAERRRTCDAEYFCYVEIFDSVVTRGCINNRSPLMCENRKPAKPATGDYPDWPYVYCCKDEDYCNRDIVPVVPTVNTVDKPEVVTQKQVLPADYATVGEINPYVKHEYDSDRKPCPNNDSSKLNPIYIAVPIAGVCVLLALIIFAMYLLRRRNDFYAHYDTEQYHEQMAKLANKQNDAKAQGCETNRCTDSERSSQGSETKLFLNA